jgi:hypothetical protein
MASSVYKMERVVKTPVHMKEAGHDLGAWGKSVAGNTLKEYLAVIAALLCFSRIGLADHVYSGMCLYVILVVFSFPFLNPYLFIFLRLGPWAKWDTVETPKGVPEVSVSNTFVRYAFQIAIMLIGQLFGAYTAAMIRNRLDEVYDSEYTPPSPSSSNFTTALADMHTKYAIDEMFCVAFLLIGLTHLIQCYCDVILVNVHWSKPSTSTPTGSNTSFAVEYTPVADGCDAPVLTPITPNDIVDTPTLNNPVAPNAIAGNLIATACVLVSCLSVAFPSAHQSLHVTMYLASLKTSPLANDEELYRIIGGSAGTILALGYYYAVFAKGSSPRFRSIVIGTHTGAKAKFTARRVPIDFRNLL